MQKYLFVLGRNPELSIMETSSFLISNNYKYRIVSFNKQAAIIELETKNIQEIQQKLGSIVKIGKILIETIFEKETFKKELNKIDLIKQKKFFYAINNFSTSHNIANYLKDYLKKRFKEEKTRAVLKHGKHEVFANPSQVLSWKLIESGTDFLVYTFEKKIFFAITITSSNPKELEQRDNGRPAQKPLQAVSIRLAKILVNLSKAKEGDTILDPFCGIGTVLMEAMNSGKNAVGVDKDAEMIESAKKNLNWFRKQYNNSMNYKLALGDSSRLSSLVQKNEIDAVATEPYLGPLISILPSEERTKKLVSELERLYSSMFSELGKILKKDSIVVIILPQLIANSNKRFRVREQVFYSHGFRNFHIIPELKEHNPYLYRDEESKIERLIYVLRKQ
ncbi:MAG: DNA methyltransferase [archaeon]|nr:DNA methyltransferase [archaeon]